MSKHINRAIAWGIFLLSLTSACSHISPAQEPMRKTDPVSIPYFPFHPQKYSNDCGVVCLRMICSHYNKEVTEEQLTKELRPDDMGTSLLALSETAEKLGFRTLAVRISLQQFIAGVPLPCIIHWHNNHFVIPYAIDDTGIYIADPADTLRKYDFETFCKNWYSSDTTKEGIVLALEPL